MDMEDIEQNWHRHAHGQGLYVLSFYESAGKVSPIFERRAREIFEEHGLDDIQEDEFYHYDRVAPAFYDVVDNIGQKTMREGGRQMGRDVPWPDGVETVHDGLQTIDAIHQQASPAIHNGNETDVDRPAGGYTYDRRGQTAAHVGITKQYPNPPIMAEGVFLGIVDSLSADGTSVTIDSTETNRDERRAWELSWQ
jgi:hypothetical protein